MSLEKFIRAGDQSLLKLYRDQSITNDDLIAKMIVLSKDKKEELESIKQGDNMLEAELKEKKRGICNFLDSTVSNRFKNFNKKELLFECVMNQEPKITAMTD